MESLLQDLRYALRSLRQHPLFTAVAVLTLALGIGATSTLFTIVDAVLLRPLQYSHADRIVSISEVSSGGQDERSALASDIAAWQRTARSFTVLAPYSTMSAVFTGRGGAPPVQLAGGRASAEFFSLLGTRPILGRTFSADEAVAGGPDVVVLSRAFWQESFGADAGIVGHVIVLDGKSYAVIGVIDQLATPVHQAAYWVPLRMATATDGADYFYSVIARIRPGLSPAAAAAELTAIHRSLDPARAVSQRGGSVAVMTLHDRLFGGVRKPLTLLFGAVIFLLLIACANVANLMLARGASRWHEVAVRVALGAGRWRLLRQFLMESLVLAVAGAATGMLFPVWAVQVFVHLSPDSLAGVTDIHVNGEVVLFTAAVGVLTGLLFGILPAWSGSRTNAFDSLKDGGTRATGSVAQRRVRGALVVAELAIALMLLTCAGLLTRSFVNVLAVDVGFQPEHLAVATVYLPRARYGSDTARRVFFESVLDRVRAIPGVQSAALSDVAPMDGFSMMAPVAAFSGGNDSTQIAIGTVGRDFPRVAGLQLLAGRTFNASDVPGAMTAILLSASAAKVFFPGGHATGRSLRLLPGITGVPASATVIGVVKDVPQIGRDVTPMPQVYLASEQIGNGGSDIVVRSSDPPAQLEAMIRHAVASVDPLQPVASFQMLDAALSRSMAPRRLNFLLLNVFAGLALLLAAIGLYGAMAFQVAQRTREMGIRMALGATGGAVRRLVLLQGMRLAIVGCVAGLLLALAVSRMLAGLLYGVGAHDAATLLLAPGVLCVVAALACYLPARRATMVDPVVALRE